MCMKASDEGCVLQAQQAELKGEVANIKERLTKVEADVGKIRAETQDGFKQGAEAMQQISKSVSDLAHDFGDRMNTIDKRLVTEKEKWGETLRWCVKLSVRVLLAGAAVAMGITTLRMFMK